MTRRLSAFGSGFAMLIAACTTAGCSLGTLDTSPCETNADCRASFGLNAVCVDDGLCRVEAASPRCDSTYPADLYDNPDLYADAVVIGNMMDRTEPKKIARERAAMLAAMQVEEVDALPDRPLAMVLCTIAPNHEGDGLDLESAATTTARYLADVVGTPAIIGPSSSDNALAVFDELTDTDTLLISPAATSPALSTAEPNAGTDERPGLLWRTVPSDSIQGTLIAQDMIARGVGNVAAVVQEGAYGDGLYEVFDAALPATISRTRLPYRLEVERSEQVSAALIDGDIEEILFISSESSDIVAFLGTASVDDNKTFFLTDAAASVDVIGLAKPELFPLIRGTRPQPLDQSELVYVNFINAYRTAYGGEDASQFSFTAHAYDAAWLVFYGAAWAHHNEGGLVTGTGIGRGMRRVSSGAPFEVKATSWTDIVDTFAAGMSVDVRGSSGELDFDPATEETEGPIEVWIPATGQDGPEVIPAP